MTRVVLLGASNIALAFPQIVRRLSAGLPGPLEIFAAFGHGRSYCTWSRVLFRRLPGIDRCGLWADLERAATERPTRTLALLTDVGNDLIYGSASEVLERHLVQCLSALAPLPARARRHALAAGEHRTTFGPALSLDPGHFFSQDAGQLAGDARTGARDGSRAVRIGESLFRPTDRSAARLVRLRSDPHSLPTHEPKRGGRSFPAGRRMTTSRPLPRWSARDTLGVRLAAPAERVLFGRRQLKAQPAFTSNGITLHVY